MRRQWRVRDLSLAVLFTHLFHLTHLTPALPAQQASAPRPVRWWEGALAAGGVALLMAADRPIQRYLQAGRSERDNALADSFRAMGQPEVYLAIGTGLLASGALSRRPEVVRAGARISASLAVASASASAAKLILGRPRPRSSLDGDDFFPFSGHDALPSGHTTMAFALATALSDEIRDPWATAGLYALACGTAWSRLNDNDHWITDVVAGAAVGVTSAKWATGRWRIFGLRPPAFLLQGGRPALQVRSGL
ncbi:MAG TPA: phosphatase PAP2 family protein [Gemmatimonadales bacterium]|nr:phosphatase PAP2 family protein [Gemmatimonadales bacterium]